METRLWKQETIKHTVNDIANSTSNNQCKTDLKTKRFFRSDQSPQKIDEKAYHDDSENAQHILSNNTSETQTESHAFIFDKMDLSPGKSKYIESSTNAEVGFDVYLKPLIDDQDGKNE